MKEKLITLRELIKTLSALDPKYLEYPVVTAGCDCNGEVGEVTIVEKDKYSDPHVLIGRNGRRDY